MKVSLWIGLGDVHKFAKANKFLLMTSEFMEFEMNGSSDMACAGLNYEAQ